MYVLRDLNGMPLGVFDSPEAAMHLVPEVRRDEWRPVQGGQPGDYDGWRPSDYRGRPHFTIRAANSED